MIEILVYVERFLVWLKVLLTAVGNNFMIKIILITTSTWSKQFLEQQLHDKTNHYDDTIMHDFCQSIVTVILRKQ